MNDKNNGEKKKLKIENLILKLNNIGIERKQKFDELWLIEHKAEAMRIELVKLIDHGLEDL